MCILIDNCEYIVMYVLVEYICFVFISFYLLVFYMLDFIDIIFFYCRFEVWWMIFWKDLI